MDGAVYEGSIVNKKPVGQGTLTYPDESGIHGAFRGWEHHVAVGRLNGLRSGYRYVRGNRRLPGAWQGQAFENRRGYG